MKIITNELKKMWNIKILVIIVVLCALYYSIALMSWIQFYPRGTWLGYVDFAHHLTERYGTTFEPDEFEDFLNYRESITSELDAFIASNPVFAEAGIFNYEDYENFRIEVGSRYNTLDEAERNLWYAIGLEWGHTILSEWANDGEGGMLVSDNDPPEAIGKMLSFYNVEGMYRTNVLRDISWSATIDSFIEDTLLSEREAQRLDEIRDSDELQGIMAPETIFHTWRYGRSLAVLVILVTLILTSPLITTDRANRVNWLQYSSKQGRNILKKQFIAVLISAAFMTTILIIVFAGIFLTIGVQAFWNNGLNSFMNFPYYWLPITYGQYCLLIIGIIYLLSIGAAVFAFVLSRFSQNMIRLMFKIIPFFVAAQLLSNWILSEFLAIYIGGNVLVQLFTLMFSLIGGIVIVLFVMYREKGVELN